MTEYIALKHKITGIVDDYPVHYANSPIFSDILEPTDESALCVDCTVPALEGDHDHEVVSIEDDEYFSGELDNDHYEQDGDDLEFVAAEDVLPVERDNEDYPTDED